MNSRAFHFSRFFDVHEFKRLMILMVPLYISNLMQMGMGVTDTIVAGRAGSLHLAAVGMGCALSTPIMVAFGCLLTIIGPIISRLRGAGRTAGIGILLNNAKLIGFAVIVLQMLCILACSYVFAWVTDSVETAAVAARYLYFIMLAVPANVFLRTMMAYFEGHGKMQPGMVVSFIGVLANIPLNYLFVFGCGPLPALGGAGCGLATAVINWLMLASMAMIMYGSPSHRPHIRQMWAWRQAVPAACRQILRLGTPLAIAAVCEMSFFSVLTLVIAPLGDLAVAAQQVSINVSGVTFMLPLSFGVAVSIRAAYHVGAKNKDAFHSMLSTVLIIMFFSVALIMALMMIYRRQIIGLYTDDTRILTIATPLLFLCALYQLPDATQALMAGLLRGCHDTKCITAVNMLGYWAIGFPLACIFIHTDWLFPAMGPAGAWCSFILALSFVAVLLTWRFIYTARRLF